MDRRRLRPWPFELSLAWTLLASVLLILASLLLIFFAEDNSLLSTLGGALFSLGLVTLLSEFYLRSAYTFDLINLVNLSSHVSASGFQGVRLEREVDWADSFRGATKFKFYLPSPSAWLAREWPVIADLACKRGVSVKIYLPDPNSSVFPAQAELQGIDGSDYTVSLQQVSRTVQADWRSAEDTGRIHKNSSIDVYWVTDVMPIGLVSVDSRHFILAQEVAVGTAQNPLALEFHARDQDYSLAWLKRQWDNVDGKKYDRHFASPVSVPSLDRGRQALEGSQ